MTDPAGRSPDVPAEQAGPAASEGQSTRSAQTNTSGPSANIAVPIGALLIIASFFLPWLDLEASSPSGFDIAFRVPSARVLLNQFGMDPKKATGLTRRLVIVPLMAVGVLLLNATAGSHVLTRVFSRMLTFATGVFLSIVLGYVGLKVPQLHPAPAFWMTFSGGLLIAVGSFFDVLRRA